MELKCEKLFKSNKIGANFTPARAQFTLLESKASYSFTPALTSSHYLNLNLPIPSLRLWHSSCYLNLNLPIRSLRLWHSSRYLDLNLPIRSLRLWHSSRYLNLNLPIRSLWLWHRSRYLNLNLPIRSLRLWHNSRYLNLNLPICSLWLWHSSRYLNLNLPILSLQLLFHSPCGLWLRGGGWFHISQQQRFVHCFVLVCCCFARRAGRASVVHWPTYIHPHSHIHNTHPEQQPTNVQWKSCTGKILNDLLKICSSLLSTGLNGVSLNTCIVCYVATEEIRLVVKELWITKQQKGWMESVQMNNCATVEERL